MPKYIKLLPPVELLHKFFKYHEDEFVRAGKTYVGGLFSMRSGKIVGGVCPQGYLRALIPGQPGIFTLSRIVYSMHFGNIETTDLIDHISGDRTDNRISNLRLSDNGANQMNRFASRVGSASKYIGVCRTYRKIRAVYSLNGAPIDIGLFNSEKEAAIARDEVVFALHGSLARLNRDLFPEDFK